MNERDAGFVIVFVIIAIVLTLTTVNGCQIKDELVEIRQYLSMEQPWNKKSAE